MSGFEQEDLTFIVENVPDESLFVVTEDIAEQLHSIILGKRPYSDLEVKVVNTAREVIEILSDEAEEEDNEHVSEANGEIILLFNDDNEDLKALDVDAEELNFTNN